MSDDHEQHTDRATAYVLGSLSPADAAAFEFHLVECDRCTDAVAGLLEGGGLLDGDPGACLLYTSDAADD